MIYIRFYYIIVLHNKGIVNGCFTGENLMIFKTDYKLENFILNTDWDSLPQDVKSRMQGCFVDLMGAMIAGAHSRQFDAGFSLAKTISYHR